MSANTHASVDGSVNAPHENSSQAKDPPATEANRVPGKNPFARPQNQRLGNIFKGLLALQLTANSNDNNPQDSPVVSSRGDKRQRADIGADDEIEGAPAKRIRSDNPVSSTENPSKIETNAVGAAKPILIARRRPDNTAEDQQDYILEDRLLGFLYDVPGWGPDRDSPISESDPAVADQLDDDGEEPMFTMDDLFSFERYYTS